jgi:ribosome-associated heat shock protein Hsp15
LGTRRGPAAEARTLYADLAPPLPPEPGAGPDTARRDPGAGRPTKFDRRAFERLRART